LSGGFAWLPPVAPAALGLGVVTFVQVAADLKKMEAGKMDPAGVMMARWARTCAAIATVLGLVFTAIVVSLAVYCYRQF
jgi:hypothetical protein